MRVLVVGEGPHDVGEPRFWDPRQKDYTQQPGWLHMVLRQFRLGGLDITALRHSEVPLLGTERRRHMPLPGGHGVRALASLLKAKKEGYGLLVYMADTDSPDDRDWKQHYDWIADGFSRVTDAPPAVACLPKCASESWLLADAAAWRQLGLADGTALPARPESCWGQRDDPNGNHPHRLFARLCGMAGCSDSRETRVEVARLSAVPALERKCPKSFGAFRQDLIAAHFVG